MIGMAEKTVIVIGGGITGLSAAYYLQKQARAQGVPLRVQLFERDARVGGKVDTELFDGFVVEKGPDSFLARKAAAVHLCRELGLQDDLVGTNPRAKKTYIWHGGKLHRIPDGLNIGIPTQFVPFATTGLLSVSGKLRAAMDLVLPRSDDSGDRSLGGFLARRLGDEVVDRMAEPLLAGIYAGDSRNLSLRATFPQFEQLEKQYGSLIRGMLAQAKAAGKRAVPGAGPAPVSETGRAPAVEGSASVREKSLPQSVFLSLRGGLIQLVNRLAEVLGPGVIHTSTAVREIRQVTVDQPGAMLTADQAEAMLSRDQTGASTGDIRPPARYRVMMETGDVFEADAVVVTIPAYDAARILPQSFEPATVLGKIPYASVATVAMAFHASSIVHPLDGTGFVVPKQEGRNITACTWVSSKWLHTAPKDKVLLRCYVGRAGEEAIVDEPDESILRKVRQDLNDSMGIQVDPIFTRITRWRRSMPQYTVGHLERLDAFQKEVKRQFPGLFFAGAGHTGLGIPDCIQQGKNTAEQAIEHLAL